jgi:hypothetical protein
MRRRIIVEDAIGERVFDAHGLALGKRRGEDGIAQAGAEDGESAIDPAGGTEANSE